VFFRYKAFLPLFGVLIVLGDCRCDATPQDRSEERVEESNQSAEERAAALYVDMACLNQKNLSREERLSATRTLFLKHGLTDPEYVSFVRAFLADTQRSKKLAERIRGLCQP